MDARAWDRHLVIIVVIAVALIIWGVIGFLDHLQFGRGGFTYFDYTINYVNSGGAAERAGLRVGDRVMSVEGIPVEDLPLYSRWPRDLSRRAGEPLAMEVERSGERRTIEIVYDPTPRSIINLRLGAASIGLAFLLLCIWPLLTIRTTHSRRLAHIGLVAGLATFGIGPYLGTWDGVASHLQLASMLLLAALMLWFFLKFPVPKPIGERPSSLWLIFGPWALFVGCLVLELVFHPRLYHTFGGPGMMMLMAYGVLAVVAVIHSLWKTRSGKLWSSGMGWILLGLLVAIGPFLALFLATLVIPGFWMPGVGYLPLLLMVIPFTMAMAVRKQAGSAEA